MRLLRLELYTCVIVLFTLALVGCGTGSPVQPTAEVVRTSHPLVAQYNVLNSHPGLTAWVEFGPDTNYGRQTSVATAGQSGQPLSILVAGMKAQTTYHMRAHANWPGGSWVDQDHSFTTSPVPNTVQLPTLAVTRPTPNLSPAPGVELLSLTDNTASGVVSDLQGNVIWYCPSYAEPLKPMQNGHFMVVTGTDLQEVDLSCKVLRDVSYTQVNQSLQANGYDFTIPAPLGFPGGNPFHHDALVLPNGHWIALSQITKTYPSLTGYSGATLVVGDAVVDIDPNGNVAWAWSAFDHLDPNRHPFSLPDWTHSNALVYTGDGNLLVSMRNQSWILKLDYANGTGKGDVLWKLGEGGDFTLSTGTSTDWFYAQHYPDVLAVNGSQTTMAVYDDGNLRILTNGLPCGPPVPPAPSCYSRAAIFQFDESSHLATLQWQDLLGFFSFWGGSIEVLGNNNVEFDSSSPGLPGVESTILEVTQTNSPQVVWQMNIAGSAAYRGYRIPSLYPGVTWQQ